MIPDGSVNIPVLRYDKVSKTWPKLEFFTAAHVCVGVYVCPVIANSYSFSCDKST